MRAVSVTLTSSEMPPNGIAVASSELRDPWFLFVAGTGSKEEDSEVRKKTDQSGACGRLSSTYWTGEQVDVKKTKSVPALERALKILEMLASSRTGLTLAEVARHLGLARSSTHYLLLTLERTGYLYRNKQTSRYLFGVKLFTLANTGLGGLGVRQQAAPFLNTLGQKTKLTVNMAIQEQNELVLIEKVEPPRRRPLVSVSSLCKRGPTL